MDSIFNILSRKDFEEPSEVRALKKYVLDNYGVKVGVQIRDKDIVLVVPSSAAANSLRLNGPKIKKALELDKRLTFRING